MATAHQSLRQAAAIPVRSGRVCLVLSSSGRQWVIPKGSIEPGQSAGETALREAWEEAGLLGVLEEKPVGTYIYLKYGQSYHVTVFLMHVKQAANGWPEKDRRQREWLGPEQAVARLRHRGLRLLVRETLESLADAPV